NQPWLVAGDFNEVCFSSEFLSRNRRPQEQMTLFRSALADCGLLDINFEGFPYTWSNNRKYPDTVRARLDRAVSSYSWWQLFPNAIIKHLPFGGSDHAPILILCKQHNTTRIRKKRHFKFEARWIELPDCEDTIRNGWQRLSRNNVPLSWRLSATRASLITWNRQGIHHLKTSIQKIEAELEALTTGTITHDSRERERELRQTLFSLLAQEETYWKQRSKKHWFVKGDRNTAFFHAAASSRRARNNIANLRDETGTLLDSGAALQQGFTDFFNRLFTSENPDEEIISEAISAITPRLSPNMISSLTIPFSEREVETAIRSMKPLSSPGADGFPPVFYHRYWHIVGAEVSKTVLKLLNEQSMETSLNHTQLILIPKVATPEHLSQYRPISLCNVIYKI
ncbi:hypothetical protein M569_13987, partial [Genlisea aurea]